MAPPAGRGAYYAYRAGADLARLVPRSIGAPVARGLARTAPLLLADRRRQVERNLRRVHGASFGGRALRRGVDATFDSYGRYFYELFRLPSTSRAEIEARFRCPGIEQVEAAVRDGRGSVLALPHMGNWDFAGAWLAAQGFRVTVVAEAVEPPELFDWFVETRERLGIRVIPLGPSAGSEVLRAVRENEVVCLVCDRDLSGDGVEVEFFGERTTLPGGPALVALRSGTPLFPAGCSFLPGGRHEARVGVPIDTERRAGIRADVGRVTQELARRFEEIIRYDPQSWHLLQPNWPSDRSAPRHSGTRARDTDTVA